MADKFLSIFNVGGVDYNLKDAAATAKLKTLLGEHAVEALGAAAWKADRKSTRLNSSHS